MPQLSAQASPPTDSRRQEVQSAIQSACDHMRADGVNPRDYVEQLAWMFFLKAFDEAEARREAESSLNGQVYEHRLAKSLRWSVWSKHLLTKPDELLAFVDGKLWLELRNLGYDSVARQFKRIFETVRNHCRTATSFANVVNQVNRLDFGAHTDILVLSALYEGLLKDLAADSAGRAGEFYTQRHIIRAMVEVMAPKLGDRIYDPGFGTGGFLVASAEYIRGHHPSLGEKDLRTLRQETVFGLELKPLTYLLGAMNLLLHGIEGSGLELANTLELHRSNVPEHNKYEVILSNFPYGGRMSRESQDNFTIPSGSTEVLFLQHVMANLAKGGRAAVIIPEGVLFRDGADARVREKLIKEFDLHTVLSLPAGCFLPYTPVKTNILFFARNEDGTATRTVWFYELTNDGFELKHSRRPTDGDQFPDFLAKWKQRAKGHNSWTLSVADIIARGFDLSARNPHAPSDSAYQRPTEIVRTARSSQDRIAEILSDLEARLEIVTARAPRHQSVSLGDVCQIEGTLVDPREKDYLDLVHVGGANIESGSGAFVDLKTAREEGLKSGKFLFTSEDILYNKIRPYLRKVARPTFPGLCSADMYPLRANPERLHRDFLYYLLLSEAFTEYAKRTSNRAGMPKVNRKELFAYRFALPPLEVQQAITQHLDEVTKLARALAQEAHVLEGSATQLDRSVLNSAFADSIDPDPE